MNRAASLVFIFFALSLAPGCSASSETSTQSSNLKILTNKDYRGSVDNFQSQEDRQRFVTCMKGVGYLDSVDAVSIAWRNAALTCIRELPNSSGVKVRSRSQWITNRFNQMMLVTTRCLEEGNANISILTKDEYRSWVAVEPVPKELEEKCDALGGSYGDSHPYKFVDE